MVLARSIWPAASSRPNMRWMLVLVIDCIECGAVGHREATQQVLSGLVEAACERHGGPWEMEEQLGAECKEAGEEERNEERGEEDGIDVASHSAGRSLWHSSRIAARPHAVPPCPRRRSSPSAPGQTAGRRFWRWWARPPPSLLRIEEEEEEKEEQRESKEEKQQQELVEEPGGGEARVGGAR